MAQPTYEEWKQQRQADREQKYRAYEDSYRAYQAGDKSANLSVQFNQDDFDGWKQWRKQNASALDAEYTIKSLDQNVLSRVADQFKSQWGSKYYYDMFDPEDVARANAGQMPKYLDKSYDLSDPYDQWLYQNNLPSRDTFSDMYSQGVLDYQEEQEERYNRLSGFTNAWNSAIDSYDKFQNDFINNVNEARKTKGDALTEREMEDITIAMLTSGRYDDVASRFTQPTEEEDKDALTLYIEQLNTPDYSVYDNALTALQNGEDVDEAFYTSYKDADYRKWFSQKTAFTLQNLIDAYDISLTKAEMAKYTEYYKAVSNEDLPGASKELGRIKTSVEDRMKESRFDKANQAYQMLLTDNEVRSADERVNRSEGEAFHLLKPFEGEAFYTELKNRLNSFRVSDKDAADFIDLVRELDALNAESVRLDEQINYNTKADNAKAMVDAAKKDTDFDKYASHPVPRKEESKMLNTLKMYTVGNEYDYLFDPQGTAMSYMTMDERSVYAYYMNKYGADKAQEYIDNITPVLYERSSAEDTEIVQNAYNMSPILASYAGTVLQPQTALEGYVTAAQSLFGGKLPEVNDPRFRTSRMAAEARQMVADTMTPTGQFFYQTGMSMLDNLARLPLKHAGLGVMAGSVFAQGTDQALQSGATPEQAVAIGAAAAVIEVVTEKVSLENLFEPKLAGSARQIVRETLKQAGIEASEEMASEILNIIADVQIMGNDSEWEKLVQHYMHEEGLSRQQAEAKAFGDKALDVMIAGAGGFLSGGIMGGGSVTLSNYMTGLRSGGNVANALSVGTKAIGQYQQDLQTYGKLASDTITDTIKDISSLPLDSETKKSMIGDASAIANQPANHIPQAVAASYRQSVDTIKAAANRARAIGADYTARKAKVTARLTRMLDTVASARTEAETALNRGDLNAHHAAVMKAQKAMEDYRAEYSVAEAETAALQAKQTEQESELANKVKEEAANLRTAVEQAATWQDKLMVIRDRLSDQEWNAMSLEEQEAMVDETITQLDSEFDQDQIAANMADAFMRGDQSDAEFWESMLYHDLTPESTNDAVNYKDNPKDTETPLKTAKNGDNFNVINEMVNGGESNETVQAKGETNAETGRDRVSRAERVRGSIQGDRNQSREDRRKLDTVGKETRGTRRAERGGQAVTWGAQQDNDCRNAVAAFNRKNGTTLRENSVRQARNVPGYANTFARIVKRITGRDSFFIESDSNLFGGFTTRGRQYVVLTGDIVLDAFNLFHENGHNMPSLLNAIYNALDNGDIPKSDFDAYIRNRRANLAAKRGVSEDEISLGSREHLRNEFACDMFGCYGAMEILEVDRWGDYGISADAIPVIKNAIENALSSGALSESDAETADREYREVYSKGAAITENDSQLGNLNEDLAESSDIATVETNGNGDVLAVTSKTGNTLFSENTWNNGGKSLFERTLYANGYTEDEVERAVEYMQNVVNFLRNLGEKLGYDRLTDSLDASVTVDVARGKAILHTLLPNGDYPVNFDLSTICKKRVAAQRVLNALVQRGVFNRVIYNSAAIARVNDILQERGFETACAACFVEARRMQIQKWAETFCEKWNEEVDKRVSNPQRFGFGYGQNTITADDVLAIDSEIERGGKKNPKGNLNLGQGSVQVRMGRLLDRVPTLARHIQVADLVTPNGLTELRKYSSDMFSFVKSLYGAANPKIVQEFEAYNGDAAMLTFSYIKDVVGDGAKGAQQYVAVAAKELGLKKTDPRVQNLALRNYLYDIGGARSQSFSDFIIENVLDKMQLYADLAAKRLPLHEYTKEIASARIFGLTGAKTNLSIIHQIFPEFGEEHAGLIYKDGKWTYVASDYENSRKTGAAVQSIGWKDAVALQNDPRYSPNVGTIAIGFSDHHIEVMLDDANIRMIIPYHKSGLPPEFALKTNVAYATDYTDMQNTTVLYYMDADGNRISADDISGAKVDTSFLFNKALRETGDARAAAQRYLEWCAEKHPVKVKSGAYKGKKVYAVFKPKFSGGEIGGVVYKDFTTHPNYYKMLEDFSTYDGDTPSMQGAVTLTYPSKDNALNGEQLEAYKEKLRDTGIFTEAEIEKYAKVAQMSLEELIEKEMRSRQAYNAKQDAVFDETVNEVIDMLDTEFAREDAFQFSENDSFKAVHSTPWSQDFPEVQSVLVWNNAYKNDPDRKAGKKGDTKAAKRLVDRYVTQEYADSIKESAGNAILVPVLDIESEDANVLPVIFAGKLADLTGLTVEISVGKINKTKHASANNAFERLTQRAEFSGNVNKNQYYFVVDDFVSLGGTVADLRNYIEANGGKVVGVAALGVSNEYSKILRPSPTHIAVLESFGRDEIEGILREYGIANRLEDLTNAEARTLAKEALSIRDLWGSDRVLHGIRTRIDQATSHRGIETVQPGLTDQGSTDNGAFFDDFNFSENAPTKRQSRLNDAWQLYDDGSNPTEYYASNPQGFDLKTSNLLRGLMLRNGENVGGALSDANMERITDIFSRANKRHAIGLTISSPVRVFEDVTGWGGSTAEERAQNVRDGNYLKNTYYEYGNVQAANRETWISEKMRPVIEAVRNNGEYGALESSVTQMLGEGIITEEQAKNAVTDGKTMIIQTEDGVFVLDGKSRLLYSSDSKTSTEYTEEYRERVKRAIRAGKGNRVNAFMTKPKTTKSPLRVTRNGNTVTVKDASGKVVAEVTNGTNPNMKAVNAAVDALRTFYSDAYKEISNVRLENGYAPPGYIENYFPHQSRTYDGVEGFIEALTANDLPTGINGMTGTFSPGQPWNANLQTRLGTYTEFDAIRGFNRYVNGAGDTIFYTPVIQRLRQLEKAIRTQGANALTEEDAKRNSAFVDWLHEYANEWANKKSSFDRGAESIFGREAYSVSQMLTKMVSASAVGGNVSSAMSNIISGLTGYAQIDAKYTVPEIVRTVGQLFQLIDKKGQYDGFADKIPFLKRRFSDNEDILIQNMDKLKRKGSKALYAMFSAIDRFAVESVARAKYSECVANGMTDVQAIAATNDMLIKNFSDRGKGQAARVFNVKWLRPVAQFQLEVLNQMNHFRDMDRAEVEAKLADLEREYAGGIPFYELEAKALSSGGYRKLKKELAYLVLLSLWGIITRGLLGRDQTWNPYGMAKDAIEDIQEGGIKQAGEGIMEAVIDNAPFLSVLSGGGRVPIAGNLSYVTNVLEAVLNGEPEKLTNADWIKGGTAFIPGGGQLRKTLTGIDANAQGGSYTDDGKLRYPISEDDFWRSAVFGPSAVAPDDYEWGTALSKKDTAVYQELVEDGFDQSDLYDTLLNYGGSTNAERALSLLANRNDFSDDELDVIAEAVGLNYKGSLEQYAEKEANKYLKKKQKELETGDISQESYDEIENVFDEYFRLLGMDN